MATENNPDLVAGGYEPRISAERLARGARGVPADAARAAFCATSSSRRRAASSSAATGTRTDDWSGNVGLGQQLPWGGGCVQLRLELAAIEREQLAVELQSVGDGAAPGGRVAAAAARFQDRSAPRADQDGASKNLRDRRHRAPGAWRPRCRPARSAPTGTWCSRGPRWRCSSGRWTCRWSSSATTGRGWTSASRRRSTWSSARAEVAQRRESLIIAQTLVRQAEDQLRAADPRSEARGLLVRPPRAGRRRAADRAAARRGRRRPQRAAPAHRSAAQPAADRERRDGARAREERGAPRPPRAGRVPDERPGRHRAAAHGRFPRNGRRTGVRGVRRRPAAAVRGGLPDLGGRVHRSAIRSAAAPTSPRSRGRRWSATRTWRGCAAPSSRSSARCVRRPCSSNRTASASTPRASDASCRSSGSTQEQKRFEVGMSTNFNVIQAQRDLAVARNNELLAQLDYQLALIAFETAQLVGRHVTTPRHSARRRSTISSANERRPRRGRRRATGGPGRTWRR